MAGILILLFDGDWKQKAEDGRWKMEDGNLNLISSIFYILLFWLELFEGYGFYILYSFFWFEVV